MNEPPGRPPHSPPPLAIHFSDSAFLSLHRPSQTLSRSWHLPFALLRALLLSDVLQ